MEETLIYFFYGEDEFRINKEIEKIKLTYLNKEQFDFNFDKLSNPSASQILNIADSYPVIADKRIMLIYDFEEAILNDKDLIGYINNPSPTSVIIFYKNAAKINENNNFFKTLKSKKYFKLIKIKPLYDSELPKYISEMCQEKNIVMNDETVYYFLRIIGNNLSNINNELDKISNNFKKLTGKKSDASDSGGNTVNNTVILSTGSDTAGSCSYTTEINNIARDNTNAKNIKQCITVKDIKSLISVSRAFTVFDFIDAIIDKDFRKAYNIFSLLYEEGEEPVKIISILYTEIKKIHKGKLMDKAGIDLNTVLLANNIPPFLKNKFIARMNSYNLKSLSAIIEIIEETDIKLKTSGFPDNLIFEELIFKTNLAVKQYS
jgi:DNA polymerase-3 subunit delta